MASRSIICNGYGDGPNWDERLLEKYLAWGLECPSGYVERHETKKPTGYCEEDEDGNVVDVEEDTTIVENYFKLGGWYEIEDAIIAYGIYDEMWSESVVAGCESDDAGSEFEYENASDLADHAAHLIVADDDDDNDDDAESEFEYEIAGVLADYAAHLIEQHAHLIVDVDDDDNDDDDGLRRADA